VVRDGAAESIANERLNCVGLVEGHLNRLSKHDLAT
jgi:hypothetical protein